ncbi:hypothetical protein [Oceanobacillus sp. J11TS1]|uniref:hypothetical protein n=1 Tax=Oceanobacillus sp. J11TS1 TaxID=2807191 RepID=UPI001BB3F5C2|nr:hypothetical protein [Oceanobacillus sp. J11TS1]
MNWLKYYSLPILLIFLAGCGTIVTEDDLIEGKWVATAGYIEGKPKGEPYCSSSISKGIKFKDNETVYSEEYDRELSYWIEKSEEGPVIYFDGFDFGIYRSYYIEKVNEDEVGLKGDIREEENCYLERQ